MTGLSHNYIGRVKEAFRFFDDLYPPIRQAIREANYEWDPIPVMTAQHSQRAPEEIAAQLRSMDQARFHQQMRNKLGSLKSATQPDKIDKYFPE